MLLEDALTRRVVHVVSLNTKRKEKEITKTVVAFLTLFCLVSQGCHLIEEDCLSASCCT
jgi:hypothetical protein